MASLPRASAFGIVNSNIIQAVLSAVNKTVGAELKGLYQKDTGTAQSSSNSQETLSMDLQLDESGTVSRPASRRGRAPRRSTQDDDSESDDEAVDDADAFNDGSRSSRSQVSAAAAAKSKLRPQQLLALTQDLLGCVAVFATQSDEYVLNTAAEMLVSIMYLSAIKPEYSGRRVVTAYNACWRRTDGCVCNRLCSDLRVRADSFRSAQPIFPHCHIPVSQNFSGILLFSKSIAIFKIYCFFVSLL
jgi:hypothetical protein